MPHWRSLLQLIQDWIFWLIVLAILVLFTVVHARGANIQGQPTTWIYNAGRSSFDAITRDSPTIAAPFFGGLNGQNGMNPAHLGCTFGGVYVDRQNAFGLLAWDTLVSYSNGNQVNGLNRGFGQWPWGFTTNALSPYVDRFNYLPLVLFDSMTNYANNATLAGLDDCYACTNASQGTLTLIWGGPYVEGNFPVTIVGGGTGLTNGTGPPTINFNGSYASYCSVSVYYTTDGSTPTTNSPNHVFMSPSCGGGTLLGITDPSFGVKMFAFGSVLHGPVTNFDFCSLGTCWSNQVVVNGGSAPSYASVTNVNNFWTGILNDWGASPPTIYSMSLMATDSLTAAITPQIWSNRPSPGTGAQFGGIWTNHNFVAGDLTVNGLTGNATTKFLDTGWTPSSFASAQNCLMGCYVYNTTTTGYSVGAYGAGPNGILLAAHYVDGNSIAHNGVINVNEILNASSGNGLYFTLRTSSTVHKMYFFNSGSALAQIGATDATAFAGTQPNDRNIYVGGINGNGALQFPSSDTISTVIMTDGMNTTQLGQLASRLQTWRQANNGGFR